MRACFMGQNVFALGYGVATLQTPPLQDEQTGQPLDTGSLDTMTRSPAGQQAPAHSGAVTLQIPVKSGQL